MTVRGVLFDFSGTVFRLFQHFPVEHAGFDLERQAELMRRLTAPAERPSGLDPELHAAWERRDLDPELHRRVYQQVVLDSGLDQAMAERLYAALSAPESWTPYPDAEQALRSLVAAGIPVGVLSNISWDIRTVFDRYGLTELVTAFVLSYEVGRVKPEPELFRTACAAIGTDPAETLMIGDSPEADGGAAAIGCPVVIVDPLPVAERPNALVKALEQYDLG